MATKTRAGPTVCYDAFEPLCNWNHEEGRKTLIVNLPEFRKEELKVSICNGTLKISGEHPVSETRSRFYKEIKVPNDCNGSKIKANFIDGLLHIVMPTKFGVNEGGGAGEIDVFMKRATIMSPECSISRVRWFTKVAVSAAVVAVASVLGAYIMCKCRSSN
ncbi:hypothetical protein F0562_017548 [Nyssa sinensis]|uniref:SHSP domain-containing protein n=1 Tax=Nyssa sinensis TaxID=561372 RepID=A0A5J4ZFB9_9ASTE|nr:hypothetical protein F0562_017548 [Nyssa sinensis]